MVVLTSEQLERAVNSQRERVLADPIDDFVLFVVGAHAAGKDTILHRMQELKREEGDVLAYGAYRKLEYWTDREPREGEGVLREPGAIHKSPEEIQGHIDRGGKFLAWYRSSNGWFYAFPQEFFPKGGDPTIAMVHVATDCGLRVWQQNQTLSHNITAFINVPGKDDRRARVRSRLIDSEGKPLDDRVFEESLAEMSRINSFFSDTPSLYDVMYNNSNPGDRGIRKALYGNPQESVQKDIALRLNALCHLHRDASIRRPAGAVNGISVAALCDQYIRRISLDLFGHDLEALIPGVELEGQVQRAVMAYAEKATSKASLDPSKLYPMLEKVTIRSVDLHPKGVGKAGTAIVYLEPQHHIPTSVAQLLATTPESPDYHALRILAQRIYGETKTRPDYIVNKNANLVGFSCSLTDMPPKSQREGQYHRLEIRLGYN